MPYKLSAPATDDLLGIYIQGVLTFGQAQAENYYASLEKSFDFLTENPRSCAEREECKPPVRVHPHGSHIVVYRIEAFGVWIIRICHARENWMAMNWNIDE
jgi:toxin ParE1/3/4